MSGRVEDKNTLIGEHDRGWVDPQQLLLDNLLRGLSQEEQIAHLTTAIQEGWSHGSDQEKIAVSLLVPLENIFGKDEIGFRSHLRGVYMALPARGTVGHYWNDPEQRNFQIPVEGDVATGLKVAIIAKVFKGWSAIMRSKWEFGKPQTYSQGPDADDCFRFVCDAYRSAQHDGIIRKSIIEFFQGVNMPTSNIFDEWILRNDIPVPAAMALLHKKLDIEGLDVARAKLRALIQRVEAEAQEAQSVTSN